MERRVFIVAIAFAMAGPGCRTGPRGPEFPDEDGCLRSLDRTLASFESDLAGLLGDVVKTTSAEQAHTAVLSFLMASRRIEPNPEVFCAVKTALFAAPELGQEALDVWQYWTVRQVFVDGCTDGAYHSARKHLRELRIFAEASGDAVRVRWVGRNQNLVEEIHQEIVTLNLCPKNVRSLQGRTQEVY